MRILFLIVRIITGALFVFSGIVKLNDPSGFAIKLNEYFDVFSQDISSLDSFFQSLKDYSIFMSGSFCALEVLLGFAMLLGWQMRMTLSITTALIVFFTFLTGYSAVYNKVTDCGCFGDLIHLEPWDSFKKDLILLLFVGILLAGIKFNRTLFQKMRTNQIMMGATVMTLGFGLYCYFYLPVWDFLPYKKGNDIDFIMNHIPPGERATDSVEIKFVMQKGSDSVKVTTLQYADFAQRGYVFVRQDRKVIVKGYSSPIHDFAIHDLKNGIDYKDSFLKYSGYQVLFIAPFLSKTDVSNLDKIKELHEVISLKPEVKFYALSSASIEASTEFALKNGLKFSFFAADQKMLMTMARYNPTIYLFKGSVVVNKWSGKAIPQKEELEKYMHP